MKKEYSGTTSFIIAVVLICVGVYLLDFMTPGSLRHYGLLPRNTNYMFGIFTYPFLHGSWSHLIGNMVSFSVLAYLVSRLRHQRLITVFVISWLLSGAAVWVFGRSSMHIGLSGVIYGLWAYLIVYGLMYRSLKSIFISVVVMIFYGSMVWGVFPINRWVSFESHLFGALAGAISGYLFAKQDDRRDLKQQRR